MLRFVKCNTSDPQSEILQQKNDSCRPGSGVTGEVKASHTSNGGIGGHQLRRWTVTDSIEPDGGDDGTSSLRWSIICPFRCVATQES
ncbi:hypothetical protein HAX54_005509 [Datura stramonium]|uniref:Uncharacterized protein n=1 Tax=Datura stramonium TaxID=4076 RepID=A0ABS8TAA1_DATST|nr:hypothetical protein [Datura stramonium]